MRVNKIDLLRFIGLSMIILAHVGPPGLLFQLRNFDVPLMVLVSGMSFGIAFKPERYRTYVWRRIKRLLFPVWIFLSIYFIALLLISPKSPDLEANKVLTSYFLISGIGYVWIIRVFLLVALASPFIYMIHRKIPSDKQYLSLLLTVLLIYEIARYLVMPFIEVGSYQLLTMIVYYIVPYSLLFALGLRIPQLQRALTIQVCIFFAVVWLCLGGLLWFFTGGFVPTQLYKYPPSIYYFSYAVMVSLLLWLIGGRLWAGIESVDFIKKTILFVAQNSIWIYLWHIPLIKHIDQSYFIKYVLVFSLASIITFFQVWFVRHVLINKVNNNAVKRDLKMLLTG